MNMEYYKKYEPLFGSWRIVREIGAGSFGKVFEIERRDFGYTNRAALKAVTIPQSSAEVESVMDDGMDAESVTSYFKGFVDELLEEFRIMSRLKGESNIVSCEDYTVIEHTDGIGWDILMRMELLTPLLKYTKSKPLDIAGTVNLGIDICRALELCRKQNIIHRDIKPENIFVSDSGKFKLGDFGIARTVEKTSGGLSKKGTYTYMAPEVYRGEDYGASVDIYSLGIVLYRYANGNRAPFLPPAPEPITHSDRAAALERRIKGEKLPRPVNADDALADIILKACAYNASDRYASAAEMRKDLETLRATYGMQTEVIQVATVTELLTNTEMTELLADDKTTLLERSVDTARGTKTSKTVKEDAPVFAPVGETAQAKPQIRFVEEKKRSKAPFIAVAGILLAVGIGAFAVLGGDVPEQPQQEDWSEWNTELPSGVSDKDYEIEKLTKYRSRSRETASSTTESEMEGWEKGETTEKGETGQWSAWSTNPVQASDTREVEKQTRYRSREQKTMTGSSSEKSGWTLYDTTYKNNGYGSWSSWSIYYPDSAADREIDRKTQYSYRTKSYSQQYTDWSSWSSWSFNSVSSSSTRDVQTRTVYMYCYFQCEYCGNHWHGYGFPCYTWGGGCGKGTIQESSYHEVWGTTPQSQMGFQDWHGTGHTYAYYNGERVFRNVYSPNASDTQYRYRTRSTETVINYSSWSSYSDSYVSENSSREVRTRTLYRYRDMQKIPVYHFKQWGEWSGWSTDIISATDSRQVESRVFYRYCDTVKEKTYNFYRWSDWSDWSESEIEKNEDTDVETAVYYRYRARQ